MDANGGKNKRMLFKVTVGRIVEFLIKKRLLINGESERISIHNKEAVITGVAKNEEAMPGKISWISKFDSEAVGDFDGSLLICPIIPNLSFLRRNKIIQCHNPKLAMAKIINEFFTQEPSISFLKPNPLVKINWQESSIQNVELGTNVIIGPNCCIGIAGQGYAKNGNEYYHFPHLGKVIIEDNVTIGANTVICRGALSNTIIGKGTKIGNQVNIGHNVKIGKNTMIIAGAVICGSVEIGDNAWIGPGAKILNKIKIGKGAQVGIGAVIIKDVPDGKVAFGNPARIVR